MAGALRVFRKDLFELLQGFRGIVMVLVLPPLLLLSVGQLRSQPGKYRLLVAGIPAKSGPKARKKYDDKLHLLRELSVLDVTTQPVPALDPELAMHNGHFDLLLNVDDGSNNQWLWYTAETDPSRLAAVQQLVTGIQRAFLSVQGDLRSEAEKKESVRLVKELGAMGAFPSPVLLAYYPDAASKTFGLLPRTVALIICFLPFVLTASSLLRERDSHMLEVLLAAPEMKPFSLLLGKCFLPIIVTLFDLLIMLVLVQSVYRIYVKPGIIETLGVFVLPALLSSTFVGLAVSSVIRSQSQAMLSSAICFLYLTLFSGFLFPIAEASKPLQWISKLSPLTFLHPVLDAWMFGAGRVPNAPEVLLCLVLQSLVYGGLALATFYYWLRSV